MNYINPFQTGQNMNPMGQFQDMFKNYFGNLDSAAQGFDPVYKGIARVQLETMGFVSRRAQAYLEIPTRLAQCRTPHDLVNEQLRFWQTAAQQYSESSNRIMTAWMQTMTAPMTAMQQGRSGKPARDYITFPEPAREPAAATAAPIDARQRERRVA